MTETEIEIRSRHGHGLTGTCHFCEHGVIRNNNSLPQYEIA